MKHNDLIVRDMTPDDTAFFFKSVLQHYKHSSPHTRGIPDHVFYDCHHYLISRLQRRPSNVVKFAALREDPTLVFGFIWADHSPETVHYIYVKKAFRRLGIARFLLEATFEGGDDLYFTHFTKDAGFILERFNGFIFNPYLLHDSIWTLQNAVTEDERHQ